MIIISDTSPITSLLAIDHIQILPDLYDRIIIPNGVKKELLRVDSRRKEVEYLLNEDWLEVKQINDHSLFKKIFAQLDRGESEAITLGVELSADILLIDETKGRTIAKSYGLQVTGLLGALIEAKTRNIIPFVKEVLDDLINEAGFYVKRDLYDAILEAANEK